MRTAVGLRQARRVRSRVLNRSVAITVGSVAAAALLAACAGDSPTSDETETVEGPELADVEVAGVGVQVPVGWNRRESETNGFSAYQWLSPAADDGTRVAVSVDVACSGGATAEDALDRYLSGPQFSEFAVRERSSVTVAPDVPGARFTATYSLPVASTGVETPATRHGLLAAEDGVAALVLVEGVSTRVDDDLADAVLTSVEFDAATDERVAACAALTDG